MLNKTYFLLVLAITFSSMTSSANGQTCVPPAGFVDTPPPAIAPAEQLVSHTEQIEINKPLVVVLDAVNKPLKDVLKKSDSLPGVSGEHMLTAGAFEAPGSRRLTCLTDGTSVVEQVLERQADSKSSHFRYVVWKYTTEKAKPISYGIGDFVYAEQKDGHTKVTWVYSFKLKEDRFPGSWGAFGRFLFRVGFLDRGYAEMMRGVLQGTKTDAELRSSTDTK